MVKFDSKTHVLSLSKRSILSDGSTPVELSGQIDLSGLSEPERQRLISVAKLVTNWCSGHDIASNSVQKIDDETVKLPSQIDKVKSLIERSTDETPVSEGTSAQKVE